MADFCSISYNHFREKGPSYHANLIDEESGKISELVLLIVRSSITSLILIMGSVSICFFISCKLSFAFGLVFPPVYLISRYFHNKISAASKVELQKKSLARESLNINFSALALIKIFNLQSLLLATAKSKYIEYYHKSLHTVKTSSLFQGLSSNFIFQGQVIIMGISGYAVIMDHITVGDWIVFTGAFWKIASAVNSISHVIIYNAQAIASLANLNELKAHQSKNINSIWAVEKHDLAGTNINLAIGRNDLFKALNYQVVPNQKIAVVGSTGQGKTTLGLMMAGIISPDSGKLISNSSISAMLGTPKFIDCSLSDHLLQLSPCFRNDGKTMKMLNDFGLIKKLNENPINFSDGEKKKTSLLFALLKEANYVILDEPFAGVDKTSKVVIANWIIETTQKCSLILITHGDLHLFGHYFDQTWTLSQGGILVNNMKTRSANAY